MANPNIYDISPVHNKSLFSLFISEQFFKFSPFQNNNHNLKKV